MFGQSIIKTESKEKPTAYDVLTCLVKYPVESFEDFCKDYGYDDDSRKAETIYKLSKKEWSEMSKLWSEKELEMLREVN